ncbi:hypothetical protein WR25_05224 isoform C [Diploscapter pachys]|uniref:Complexin n=1 Tax=Diploscapter pachys TaxID=2018661 RepID=A0A2A2LPN2_9BILA|nr:hypothetical protein WR25_05224 isoform C [Diploscapter pachys]
MGVGMKTKIMMKNLGGLEKLAGDNESGSERSEAVDPELAAARLEQELRRKEKHRKMEAQRERVRDEIRAKYNIKKKDDSIDSCIEGRIAGNRKTPEQVAAELIQQEEDEGVLEQLGIAEPLERAKSAVASAFETAKSFLPFGQK